MTDDDEKDLERMSQRAAKKNGRPIKWTEEAIDDFADQLLEWAKKPDSLVLVSFVLEKDFSAGILQMLAKISPRFAEALNDAKRMLGVRREVGTITKVYEPRVYDKSQRMYDPDYDSHLKLKLYEDELAKANAKLDALQKKLAEAKRNDDDDLVEVIKSAVQRGDN
jgi:hypothetical protein